MKIDVSFKKKEETNFMHPEFSEVEIWIGTYGDNANRSNISKEAYEKAIPSLDLIPIVGVFDAEKEDFKGHGNKVVIEDGNVKIVKTTKPYGVVPQPSNARWQKTENGAEYLVCDGILWTGRYPEAEKVFDNESNQSMEIHVNESSLNKDKIQMISDFYFSSLAILGADVEPCFPEAKIVYSLNKDDFTEEFSLLINEIENIKKDMKGGTDNVNREEIINKYSFLKGEEFEKIINDSEISVEELEEKLFSLSVNSTLEKIEESLSSHKYTYAYPWGEEVEYKKYGYVDLISEDKKVIVIDYEEKGFVKFLGINYELDNDDIVLDFENAKRYIRGDWKEYVEGDSDIEVNPIFGKIEDKMNSKMNEFEEMKSENERLKAENEELENFKRETLDSKKEEEIEELFSKFEELSEVEGFNDLKENAKESDLADVEMQLFAMLGKLNFNKKKTNNPKPNNNSVKIPIVNNTENSLSEAEKRYGAGIAKYI